MKKKIKLIRNHGILFWITGLCGSGKTRIVKKDESE
jgi:adenylylsulfate kinase-like enzyme|tara:strand:+ start:549 stop:656 length:108 start_codon:yes stop_codon:yes gene_type:complete